MLQKDVLDRLKLSLELLIYTAVIGVILLAIFRADIVGGRISQIFREAGWNLKEVTLFGAKLEPLTEAAAKAESDLKEITARYSAAIDLLKCQSSSNCDATQASMIGDLIGTEPSIISQVSGSIDAVNQAIREAETLNSALQATQPETPASGGGWIAIVGADRTVESANDEVKRLRANDFDKAGLLFADGWYRTVVFFDSREAAQAALPTITRVLGRAPYIREFDKWCRGAVQGPDFIRCGT